MKNKINLPSVIPVFPLSNFIIFPETTVPLNIFEPRYIQMIDDSMKSHRLIGMVQPKKTGDLKKPDLYSVGTIAIIKNAIARGTPNSKVSHCNPPPCFNPTKAGAEMKLIAES